MTTHNSDFVLDDDLDEDEDILQFQAEQQCPIEDEPLSPQPTQSPSSPSPTTPNSDPADGATSAEADDEDAQVSAVIVDGLPLSSRRADLDALLATCASSISNVRLRRLEGHGLLRMRVEFSDEEATHAALARDGAEWNGLSVSVKRASDERWNASTRDAMQMRERRDSKPGAGLVLPDTAAVSQSFWSAFGAARTLAGRLEEGARQLGERLEHELHVTETVEKGRARARDVDAEYNVSGRVAEMAQVGRDTASAVDKKLGFSDGVSTVVDGVGGAARIVAREVDENLRVSEKARDAANAAMTNPTVGAVARSVVGTLDSATPPRKKTYRPSSNAEHEEVDSNPSPGDAGVAPVLSYDVATQRDGHVD